MFRILSIIILLIACYYTPCFGQRQATAFALNIDIGVSLPFGQEYTTIKMDTAAFSHGKYAFTGGHAGEGNMVGISSEFFIKDRGTISFGGISQTHKTQGLAKEREKLYDQYFYNNSLQLDQTSRMRYENWEFMYVFLGAGYLAPIELEALHIKFTGRIGYGSFKSFAVTDEVYDNTLIDHYVYDRIKGNDFSIAGGMELNYFFNDGPVGMGICGLGNLHMISGSIAKMYFNSSNSDSMTIYYDATSFDLTVKLIFRMLKSRMTMFRERDASNI